MKIVEELQNIIIEKSFKYSEKPAFKLSSGKLSKFYFDCKKTTLDPRGSNLIGKILYDRTKGLPISGAGGLTLGADPMASSLMHISFQHGKFLPQFIVRKDLKKHGAIKWIEGDLKAGASVIVLDDVVTTGNSVIKAIDRIQEDGFKVYGVIVLIDREELGGMDKIRLAIPGKPVNAITTRSEIMDICKSLTQSESLKLRYA